jgi:hypothetical protein
MSMRSPFVIGLNPVEEAVLIHRTRGSKTPHGEVVRARIILAAARGEPFARIATGLGLHVDTVRKWCKRFAAEGIRGLKDRPRSGRPRFFTPVQVAGIKVLACTPPAETDLPLSRLSISAIRTLAVAEHLVEDISMSTMFSRWLAQDAIKPWQHRSWIFPRDPDFAPRAGHVLDLYARTWEVSPSGRTTTWSARMRNPSSRPCTAGIPPCLWGPGAHRVRISSRKHPGLLRAPQTCTGHRCWAASRRRPASCRSCSWQPR